MAKKNGKEKMEKKKWKRKMIKVKQAVKFTYLYFFKTLAF